mmetsp:Transcript_31783/g.62468  ORF Transcript_31783/g.62468 Transcript_31783/m.62468 type:complete len:217 (-) Transcript_31783:493-1143(-)
MRRNSWIGVPATASEARLASAIIDLWQAMLSVDKVASKSSTDAAVGAACRPFWAASNSAILFACAAAKRSSSESRAFVPDVWGMFVPECASRSRILAACELAKPSNSLRRASRARTAAPSARAADSRAATCEAETIWLEGVGSLAASSGRATGSSCLCLCNSVCSLSTCCQLSWISFCNLSDSWTTRAWFCNSSCSLSIRVSLDDSSRSSLSTIPC